jgi:hypothetical protein
MPKGDDLLKRARVAKGGWRQRDLERLYRAFGFESEDGKKHIKFWHPKHPHLYATVTKSSGELPTGYVTKAVHLIDEAVVLERQETTRDG